MPDPPCSPSSSCQTAFAWQPCRLLGQPCLGWLLVGLAGWPVCRWRLLVQTSLCPPPLLLCNSQAERDVTVVRFAWKPQFQDRQLVSACGTLSQMCAWHAHATMENTERHSVSVSVGAQHGHARHPPVSSGFPSKYSLLIIYVFITWRNCNVRRETHTGESSERSIMTTRSCGAARVSQRTGD